MATLQLLLHGALIFIIATVSSGQNYEPRQHIFANVEYDTSKNAPNPRPTRYDIALKMLNIDNHTAENLVIEGDCNITIRIAKPIPKFILNLSPSINVTHSIFYAIDDGSLSNSYDHTTRFYTNQLASYMEINFNTNMNNGMYMINIKYTDLVRKYDKGFFRIGYMRYTNKSEERDIRWLVASNSQPNGAHRVFPCLELPGSRTPIKISITVNNQYKILSNMVGYEKHENYSDGMQKVVFRDTPQIPVYQVAIIIYNYVHEVQFTQADKIYSRNSDIYVNYTKAIIANVTFLLQKEWHTVKDVWNPIVNYALIPGFPYDSADGWRLVFLKEAKAIYNKELDTYGHKLAVTRFLAHKVTYQWLGCIVSLYNWTDLWINDGVSIFYGTDVLDKISSTSQMMNLFVVQDVHDALNLDTIMEFDNKNLTSFDIDSSFYFFRYLKGPALIRMLYHMMTSSSISLGIRNHLTSNRRRVPPTAEEFWRFLQEAENDNRQSNFKNKTIGDVMNSWTQDNYPILYVRTSIDAEQQDIVVTVTQENSESRNWHRWWILITWFTDHLITYSDNITPSLCKWLRPHETRKVLTSLDSTSGWIIVNTKRNGYYRVSYDEDNLRRIGWFLRSGFKEMHALNRAQLIDDAFYFVKKDKLNIEIFWDLIRFLSKDTDYIAWYPMLKALEYMSPVLAFSNNDIRHLKSHLLQLILPLVKIIGYESKPNNTGLTECLREEVLKWICILGDSECTEFASEQLEWHLQNHQQNKIPPGWKKWTYCEGVKDGNSLLWHNAMRVWDEERDDVILQYLMCADDYYIATQSFSTLKDRTLMPHAKPKDEIMHFIFFLEKYANHTIIIDDILEDFLPNKPGNVTEIAALNIIICNMYNTEGLQKVENYIKERNPSDTKNIILSKIDLRRKQFSKITSYSNTFKKSSTWSRSSSTPSTIKEFVRLLEEAIKDNEKSNENNMKDMMDTYPIINVQTNFDAERKNIIVTVKESNDFTDSKPKVNKSILITWFTDQSIIYSDHIASSHIQWLSPDERSKPLTILKNTNGWIIVNTNRSEYYRVSYNDENWRRIGQFLQKNVKPKSYQYSNQIYALNRAQLIDDAFYFLKMYRLKINQFLNLTKFLSQDTDYIAWYPMLKALEFISPVFALYNKKIEHLKLHFLSLLVPLLNQIGYDAKSNEDNLTECLREEAIKWACILGDIRCKNLATLKLVSYLRNCSTHKILPKWRKWIYCEGLKMADKWIWHHVVHIWDEERDDTLLQYLMCSEDYYIATKFFRTLKDKSIVKNAQARDNDAIHFMFFLEKYANHTAVLENILDDKFLVEKKPRAMTRTAALVIVINNIYTMVGLEKVENYTHPYEPFIMNSRILSKIVDRKNQIYKMTEYGPYSILSKL